MGFLSNGKKSLLDFAELEKSYEWRKWAEEIPFIQWPAKWEVKAIPPMTGAIIRYRVRDPRIPNFHVSIYLDCYDMLGFVQEPYWEAYPVEGDTLRFVMNDTDKLISGIAAEFKRQLKNKAEGHL